MADIEYLNTPEMCIVCFKKPEEGFRLIKHHVRYYPKELIAFVHSQCHQLIHSTDNHCLVQYKKTDPKMFYDSKGKNKPLQSIQSKLYAQGVHKRSTGKLLGTDHPQMFYACFSSKM